MLPARTPGTPGTPGSARSARSSWVVAAIALVLMAGQAQAQVTLRWKLEKDAAFEMTTETATKSVTTTTDQFGNNNKEEETETENASRTVKVTEVTASGNYKMEITLSKMDKKSVSKERTMTIKAEKDGAGKKKVEVNIKSSNPILGGDDVKGLMEKLASNMLDYKMLFEVTPQGVVVSAKGEGDPFANLPEDTQVTKMIAKTVRRMINAEDLPAMAAAEAFTQLSDGPVDLKGQWPLRRTFSVMGLSMDGKGTTTLTKLEAGDGGQLATLSEKLVYKVDATKFNKMLQDLMQGIFADAGLPVQMTVNLKATKDIDADATTVFHVEKGHNTSTTWSGLTIPFGGTMTINVAGQQNTVNMDVQVNVTTKNVWTRK